MTTMMRRASRCVFWNCRFNFLPPPKAKEKVFLIVLRCAITFEGKLLYIPLLFFFLFPTNSDLRHTTLGWRWNLPSHGPYASIQYIFFHLGVRRRRRSRPWLPQPASGPSAPWTPPGLASIRPEIELQMRPDGAKPKYCNILEDGFGMVHSTWTSKQFSYGKGRGEKTVCKSLNV